MQKCRKSFHPSGTTRQNGLHHELEIFAHVGLLPVLPIRCALLSFSSGLLGRRAKFTISLMHLLRPKDCPSFVSLLPNRLPAWCPARHCAIDNMHGILKIKLAGAGNARCPKMSTDNEINPMMGCNPSGSHGWSIGMKCISRITAGLASQCPNPFPNAVLTNMLRQAIAQLFMRSNVIR